MACKMPDECSKQWEILLLLIASEEKKIKRTKDTELATMNYFLRNEGVKQILLQWLRQMKATYAKKTSEKDTALKCDEVSELWRKKGNEKFHANLIKESYSLYVKSVIYADQKGPKFSLALANRSAALLKLKRFEECLIDIDLALAASYPAELRYKLLLRRAECYVALNKRDNAVTALAVISSQDTQKNLSQAQIADIQQHTKILEKKLEQIKPQEPVPESDVLPELRQGANPNFVSASDVVDLCRTSTVGRHVMSNEPLHRGDVLFSEEPYAWVTIPSEIPVCDSCCATNINLMPCATCSRNMYCNADCRTRAAAYHRWECIGAQSELFSTIGIGHLALRVLLVTTNSGFPAIPAACHSPGSAADLFNSYASVDSVHIYHKNTPAFYRMFNLVTNFQKMNNTDYIQYALTATMLTLYLEHFTQFFEHMSLVFPYDLSNMQLRLFAGALMLRTLGQIVCNANTAISLSAVVETNGRIQPERVRRASAIYPSAAMMNHSCDPNIINTFYKARLIVRCSRDLAAGMQMFNCYGPHSARDITVNRRKILRDQYFFICTCMACNDAERKDHVLIFNAYACTTCRTAMNRGCKSTNCPNCQSPYSQRKSAEVVDEADTILTQAKRASHLEERIFKTYTAFRLKQHVLYRHNTKLREAADLLAGLYADYGDFAKSVELIKQNLQSLEFQFGSFSVEVAHELRKLTNVMLDRVVKSPPASGYRDWCLETHKVIKKAVLLMDLNYGSWEPVVKHLKEQEKLVAALVEGNRSPDAAAADIHQNLHYNLKI